MQLDGQRSLLIIGFMSTGTRQMALELENLGLEVQHEQSDARHFRCRDGTVSWAHAIRFLRFGTETARADAVRELCSSPGIDGFSFAFFSFPHDCAIPKQQDLHTVESRRKHWDACWETSCREILHQELGCAHTEHQPPRGEAHCITPYSKVLLQVRQPLHTLESLVAGYCKGNDTAERAADSEQLRFLSRMGLVRPANVGNPPNLPDDGDGGCTVGFGWALSRYVRAVRPFVDGTYRVEMTPPCEVGSLGLGLTNFSMPAATRAAPNWSPLLPVHVAANADDACRARTGSSRGPGRGEQHGHINRKNVGAAKVTITMARLRRLDAALAKEMATLTVDLGYPVPN
eukprot:CAMPEP_0115837172 /NCGR_PEP_ID=MMETSP0287-20121206/5084_1 /TAXON_ID=412157 /ORGANISM="Chrysochromulina rotalis, Strain UIO044" /LENGTH=344 /DNA_ID=CAMNT_0003290675 /DNA_START=32 /DNA_END=1066 /DNA_ORIENTATION=-